MESEEGKAEYVLNETGKIYVGNHKNVCGKPWNFSQVRFKQISTMFLILDFTHHELPIVSGHSPVSSNHNAGHLRTGEIFFSKA